MLYSLLNLKELTVTGLHGWRQPNITEEMATALLKNLPPKLEVISSPFQRNLIPILPPDSSFLFLLGICARAPNFTSWHSQISRFYMLTTNGVPN